MDDHIQQQTPPAGNIPPPPAAASPVQESIGLHHRLEKLRWDALGESTHVRSLTKTAAVFIIIMCGIGSLVSGVGTPLRLLLGSAVSLTNPSGSEMLTALGLGLLGLMFLGMMIYAIYVLIRLDSLQQAAYDQTTDLLRETDLALMLTTDHYWQLISDKLNQSTVFSFSGKSTYKRIEEHLSFCAFHMDSLIAINRGQRDLTVWQLRWAEAVFRNQRIFKQKPWVYWVGGCLTIIMHRILFFIPVLITIWGSRFVTSRGALVAICEFLLNENPAQAPVVYYAPYSQIVKPK